MEIRKFDLISDIIYFFLVHPNIIYLAQFPHIKYQLPQFWAHIRYHVSSLAGTIIQEERMYPIINEPVFMFSRNQYMFKGKYRLNPMLHTFVDKIPSGPNTLKHQ